MKEQWIVIHHAAMRTGEPRIFEEFTQEPGWGALGRKLEFEGLVSVLAVPLRANGQGLGAILAGRRERADTGTRPYTGDEFHLAERISRQTAIAIENGRLLRTGQETVARLTELDSIKATVIGSASHELRTSLGAIRGYAEILAQSAQPVLKPRQLGHLHTIIQQSDDILALIDDIVLAATLEAGGVVMNMGIFDARLSIDHVLASARRQADIRGVELRADVPTGLRPAKADRDRVERVLSSLIDNAVKFTPEGGQVTVSARHSSTCRGVSPRPPGHDHSSLWFAVTDTGVGFSAEDRSRLFQAFHRGSRAVDDAVPGTGMGLAICKGIVEAHGGELGLDTAYGHGARFWFTLPLRGLPSRQQSA